MSQSRLYRLSAHVYWLSPDSRTDRPTLGAIVGRNGALIVDAGNSPAHAKLLLRELSKMGAAPPRFLVLTHWHWDHVFGTGVYNLPIFASPETHQIVTEMVELDWSDAALDRRVEAGTEIEFCRDMIKVELPDRSNLTLKAPDIIFTDHIEIDLGDVRCQVVHVGGDHAADSSVVWVPEEKIVFLGDCLSEDLYHGPRNYTTQRLFPLIDQLLDFKADFHLLGHHPEPMSRADMVAFTSLLKQIGQKVEHIGDHRELVLAELRTMLGQQLDEEHVEIADAFLAGLRKLSE